MKKFIEIELKDKRKVTLNIDYIVSFIATGEYTTVHTVLTGKDYTITATYDEFRTLVNLAISQQPQ